MANDQGTIDAKTRDRARRLRRDMSGPERALWRILRGRQLEGNKFRRQHPIGAFVADFCCSQAKLIVELDGNTHIGTGEADDRRTESLQQMGYRVLRFNNDDVLQCPQAVAETILREVHAPSP